MYACCVGQRAYSSDDSTVCRALPFPRELKTAMLRSLRMEFRKSILFLCKKKKSQRRDFRSAAPRNDAAIARARARAKSVKRNNARGICNALQVHVRALYDAFRTLERSIAPGVSRVALSREYGIRRQLERNVGVECGAAWCKSGGRVDRQLCRTMLDLYTLGDRGTGNFLAACCQVAK